MSMHEYYEFLIVDTTEKAFAIIIETMIRNIKIFFMILIRFENIDCIGINQDSHY